MPDLCFPTPLSLAIAFMGSAKTGRMVCSFNGASVHDHTFTVTDTRNGSHAVLEIARAGTPASSFHLMIRASTSDAIVRHVHRTLRAFVRETQAHLVLVLAAPAA